MEFDVVAHHVEIVRERDERANQPIPRNRIASSSVRRLIARQFCGVRLPLRDQVPRRAISGFAVSSFHHYGSTVFRR